MSEGSRALGFRVRNHPPLRPADPRQSRGVTPPITHRTISSFPGARIVINRRFSIQVSLVLAALFAICTIIAAARLRVAAGDEPARAAEPHRSPIALALSSDGTRLLSANQTSGSVSLVDTNAGTVLQEVATGEKPAGVALSK